MRLRARSIGTSLRSACSTRARTRSRAGSPTASSTPATTPSTGTPTAAGAISRALIYDSPVTGTTRVFTYSELRDEVARLAGALRGLGVERGDRVILYLPMVPEAVFAMLACARLGAIHSVVFGGFAAHELAVRIDDARPRVILSASCGIEGARTVAYKPLLDAALAEASHAPAHCVILQRPQLAAELTAGRDLDWSELVASAEPAACVPVLATDPLYILYTSGTTGRPKGVVRDNGGHAVALAWSMANVYDVHPGEVFWAASDVGWVVGHSYIVYAPLLAGSTTVLYEGKPVGTPDAGAFWRVIEQHDVAALFTAPTAIRAIRKEDPEAATAGRPRAAVAAHALPGGRAHRPRHLRVGRPRAGSPGGRPLVADRDGLGDRRELPRSRSASRSRRARPACPCPATASTSSTPTAARVPSGEQGAIGIRLPLPPGALPTLWNDDARCVASYLERYPGWYLTGDGGHIDEDGYLFVMGRIDDVINVSGHRLSTGAMEEVVATHPDVAECAVFGVPDDLRGEVPLGLVVLKAGARARCARAARRARGARPRARRAGRLLPRRTRRRTPAEDALGQDPALDDARHRSGPRLRAAGHDRRPGDHRRDRRRAGPARAPGRRGRQSASRRGREPVIPSSEQRSSKPAPEFGDVEATARMAATPCPRAGAPTR